MHVHLMWPSWEERAPPLHSQDPENVKFNLRDTRNLDGEAESATKKTLLGLIDHSLCYAYRF